ncbi:MAG: hypothetical protein KTR30_28955 [Saprospiraceae bacterium]|nr:hypothetical protein [Saprospiraceae bacterium]
MKSLSLFLLIAILSTCMACQKSTHMEIEEATQNLAGEVAGVYLGTLSYNDSLFFDYTFTVTRLADQLVSAKGEDDRFPEIRSELKEAPELSQVDWITHPDTYQLDSTFTYVRSSEHLTVIRKDHAVEFFGYRQD